MGGRNKGILRGEGMKVKIFSDDDIDDVENNINNWLNETNCEIIKILQSQSGIGEGWKERLVTITIFYKEK